MCVCIELLVSGRSILILICGSLLDSVWFRRIFIIPVLSISEHCCSVNSMIGTVSSNLIALLCSNYLKESLVPT